MIEIHYSAFNSMAIEVISKVLSITKGISETPSWNVVFVDIKGNKNDLYLFADGSNDGLKIDDEFHGPDDADWEVWVAKYNHNIEVEHALEKL